MSARPRPLPLIVGRGDSGNLDGTARGMVGCHGGLLRRRDQGVPGATGRPERISAAGNHPRGSPVVQPVRAGRPVSPGLIMKSLHGIPVRLELCRATRREATSARSGHPSRAGNTSRSPRVGRTVRRRAIRVPGSHPFAALRGVPRAVRRPAPGFGQLSPTDVPRPAFPAAVDAAARAALPPTAPPPTS